MSLPNGSTLSWRFDSVSPTYASQIKEIWQFRDLFPPLFVRSLFLVRESAVLGIGWMVLNSLAMALPFAFVLWHILHLHFGQLPPSVFLLSGFAGWILFRQSSQFMMKSLRMHKSLMVRFNTPPFLLMVSMTSVGVFTFAIANIVLLLAIAYHWIFGGTVLVSFGWNSLHVILAVLGLLALAVGLSCFTSIFNYVIADTAQAMRFIFMGWLIASPIFYSAEMIPPAYRMWFYFNPLAGLLESFRWGLFRSGNPDWLNVSISYAVVVLLLVAGLAFFLKLQRRVLDFN